jgi:hypothetical protein
MATKLTVDGMGTEDLATYQFSVSGDLALLTEADNDTVSGSTATGQTREGLDEYRFTGNLTAFTLDGPARIYLDEMKVESN